MTAPVEALSVRHYGASHGSHAHDHFQILLGLDGVLELEVNGQGCRIGTGDGCVIAPGDRHDFEAAGTSRCLVLDSGDGRWQEVRGHKHQATFAHLAAYLAEACERGLPRASRLGPALLLEAWAPLSTPLRQRMRRPINWNQLTEWALAHAHLYLQVQDLADRVHLSAAQFSARCLEEQGSSPMDWLRDLRLDQAARYRQSGLPVAEAARRVGYRSPSALTAAQRRRSGR